MPSPVKVTGVYFALFFAETRQNLTNFVLLATHHNPGAGTTVFLRNLRAAGLGQTERIKARRTKTPRKGGVAQ
jgi:hypothetical protein